MSDQQQPVDPQMVLNAVEHRWSKGDSVGEVIDHVQRRFGIKLTIDDVQPTFARLDKSIAY